MHKSKRPAPPASLLGLSIVLSLAVLPHLRNIDPWISGSYMFLVGWRLLALGRPGMLPGKLVLLLLTLLAVANVFINSTVLAGRDLGVALLVSMTGLKLLESRRRRDLFVNVLLGYFLIITQFLYYQSMGLTLYLIGVIVGLTAILVDLSRAHSDVNPLPSLGRSALLLIQALPIMLVLFFLFPRLSGPLWNLQLDNSSAVTGLSDHLAPGSVSHLSRSRSVAFRVEFHGAVPAPEQRYWRGPVFWRTDGRNWSGLDQERPVSRSEQRVISPDGPSVDYTVSLEPTRQRWLFALEFPGMAPPGSRITSDFQILSHAPVNQEQRYRLRSYPEQRSRPILAEERSNALQLPDNITPRMSALVRGWQDTGSGPGAVIIKALQHFNSNPFIYTLNPPPLRDNPADQFLFETQRGFCEHYATSFTLLMRLAGIPARVVTGYQGGEYNPHGDYYLIRQSDAHAWSEVWLDDQGWVRLDPTSAVAPERIERAIAVRESGIGVPVSFQLLDPGLFGELVRQAGFALDAANMAWRRWILDYDNRKQTQLLELLGLDFIRGSLLGIAAVIATGLLLALIAAGLWKSGRKELDVVERYYQRFCHKLAKRGLQRRANEGPRDFAARIEHERPELREPVETISALYIKLRYGPETTVPADELKRLIGEVRRFRV